VNALRSMRLLVITYGYPPFQWVGSNRWAAMTTHLRKMGHEVSVIAVSTGDSEQRDPGVSRTPDLLALPAIRRALRAPQFSATADSSSRRLLPTVHERIVVPDPKLLGWAPGAFTAAVRVLRRHPVDCIITTSPYESTHLIALGLGRRRPAWVADLQDGWTFQSWRPELPVSAQRSIDRWLERQVVSRADAITVMPRAVAQDLRNRFGSTVHHISDGWDPDLDPDVSSAPLPRFEPGRATLVYTGTLWRPDGQDPTPMFEALSRLRAEEPRLGAKLDLVIAGPLSRIEAQRLKEPPINGGVRHVGQLSRVEAVALQRRADALILFTTPHRDMVTGKIFEYLASGRPIVVTPDGNEAASIVRETGTGVAVRLNDRAALAQTLRDVVTGRLAARYRPHGLASFCYPIPAVAMTEVIREAMDRAAVRRRNGIAGTRFGLGQQGVSR
jgi:glycosyltransferase involved in cell wall biosynthesis